ncbi:MULTISPECIES: hypothetical protein [Sorangium]|uniref:Uncharacterized protein n=1 Tax=Sorangium cellulosum TaxID=56 RepID=A0A4P2R0S3_SORCE|nr:MULTISPECIES: hypothetical protein [Sorangium]AUX35493.1 hypothetical protein SOCE836_076860 [Sorangium cellulosum]WCQ94794.1 hypothetical protein NQZ70_07564 [Sorangium sp. Soce836]
MGSVLYDFLSESMLFDDASIGDRFARYTDAELRRELNRYRQHCLEHLAELRNELPSSSHNTVVFSGQDRPSIEQLVRTGLYVECHVLDDPLFEATHEPSQMGQEMVKTIGISNAKVDRVRLCEALRFLRDATPMVAADYVKLLPVSRIYEPPKDIELHYSEQYFSDALPEAVLKFFHEHARVRSVFRADVGWVVSPTLQPSRGIYVTFDGHHVNKGMIYHLHEMEVQRVDADTKKMHISMHLPTTPPDPAYFDTWVYQSINQTARHVHNNTLAEFAMSAECGALYLTQSKFTFELLRLLGAQTGGSAGYAASSLLNLDLPILDGIDAETIMRVRAQDGEAFQNFRNALERGLAEARLEDDPEKLKTKTESLVRELMVIKADEVDRQLASFRKTALAEASIALAAMVGVVCASGAAAGVSLLAYAAALFQGFKTYTDYKRQLRSNPAFFFWQLKR